MLKEKDKRIHVAFDDATKEIIEIIAKKEKRSLSDVVRRMTEEWLERYEDNFWCEIADKEKTDKTISHQRVWADV